DFVARHALEHSLAEDETALCRDMILCTDLAADIGTTAFPTPQAQLAGKMLGSADLLAQMADRIYLEKLLYLYEEFREGKVSGYDNEVDLLRKTVGFYDIIEKRLATVLENTDRYMISHFKDRWGLDRDLYHISMQNQKAYLRKIIQIPDINPLDYLRRDGIVNSYRDKNNHQNSTNNTVVDE
ncbi:MAG: hypothetical protein GY868_02270, partial [Deltaproteobacteria bacterium]|nr:hypothetical protein [Deltaproteobacteria bacterium]